MEHTKDLIQTNEYFNGIMTSEIDQQPELKDVEDITLARELGFNEHIVNI